MYKLEKTFKFEASHQLPKHDGKCQRLHGHSWRGTVVCEGADTDIEEAGPKTGMLIDYSVISAAVDPIVETYLDHYHLNDTLGLYPTSEVIAKWLYMKLKPKLPLLAAVIIEETCTSRCEYRETR